MALLPSPFSNADISSNAAFLVPQKKRATADDADADDDVEEEVLVFSGPPIGTFVRGVFMPNTTIITPNAMPPPPHASNDPASSSALVLPPLLMSNAGGSVASTTTVVVLPSLARSLEACSVPSSSIAKDKVVVVMPKAVRPTLAPSFAAVAASGPPTKKPKKVVTSINNNPSKSTTAKNACPHGKHCKAVCKECGGSALCMHGKRKVYCKECSSTMCPHGRVQAYYCKECKGRGCCDHGRIRYFCAEYVFCLFVGLPSLLITRVPILTTYLFFLCSCQGGGFCEHRKLRKGCAVCKRTKSKATPLTDGASKEQELLGLASVCAQQVLEENDRSGGAA